MSCGHIILGMDDVQAAEVAAALFTGCDGKIELRALPSRERTFIDVRDRAGIAEFCTALQREQNCYWGVASRKDSTGGRLEDCKDLAALFVDVDDGSDDLAARLNALPWHPSIVVNSGRGHHLYWLLREPIVLSEAAGSLAQARRLLRQLCNRIGGDPISAEPARVLRVPNTLNHKYSPPRRVTIIDFAPDRRYDIDDFAELLVTETPPQYRASTGLLTNWRQPVPAGQRNDAIYRLIRALKRQALPDAVIAAAAAAVNAEACEPPLEPSELGVLIEHALHQPLRITREVVVKVGRE